MWLYLQVQYIQRSPGDSITEGIGIDRVTTNFLSAFGKGYIDGCLTATDQEAVEMAYYVLRNDGIFIGPSAVSSWLASRRTANQPATVQYHPCPLICVHTLRVWCHTLPIDLCRTSPSLLPSLTRSHCRAGVECRRSRETSTAST